MLNISTINDTLVVDSRLVAEELGIQHKNLLETINKHKERLERKTPLAFKTQVVKRPQGGTYEVSYCYLTEFQATLLMTFSRNTEKVLDCKEKLVDAFEKAKEIISTVIPQQSERIRELELQLAIATQNNHANQAALATRQLDHTMLTIHGKETVLALRGMADQIIETEKPTIEVIDNRHNIKFKGQTLVQIKEFIAKKHGIKFKSGAEIKRLLQRKKQCGLIAQTPRTQLCDYVPEENLPEVYKILCNESRQMLLGE